MADKYIEEAKKQLKGQLTASQNNLQSDFNMNMNDLTSQTGEINKQYDGYVEEAKNTGEYTKADYNNAILNRGLARSSVATTGLAGINNQTAKNVTSVNTQRQAQMDNIAKLKDTLRNNLMNTKSSLEAEYNANVNSLGMSLRQRAEDVSYRNKQLAQQAQQANAELAYKNRQLAQQAAQANREFQADQKWKQMEYDYKVSGGGSSSSSSSSTKAESLADFKTQMRSVTSLQANQILKNNRQELIDTYGVNGYSSLLSEFEKSAKDQLKYDYSAWNKQK